MRLLVVEDNPVNTKVLLFTLRRFGYTADTAVNGHEALERLAAAHYDAVFMDLQMPGMDGLEAVRQLRRTRPMDVPPYVMALTANARQEDCDACHTVGMHDFLSKPVNPELILGALEQAWAWLGERGLAPPIETSGDPALARAQGRP
jgi:CheY-like chemotaxis protein